MQLVVKLNLEAFVAKIDLENLEDTDETENAPNYDRLPRPVSKNLEQEFRAYWPEMQKNIFIQSQGRHVPPELKAITIPPAGNVELPRTSKITLNAGASEPVRIGWSRTFGNLILRQQGLEEKASFHRASVRR